MSKPSQPSQALAGQAVYLAASAINSMIRVLPAGTAYFIGIVLITMFTGQLVHYHGSLARAALPYVLQLRWGWHRVERAMERGKVSLDALFDRAFTWCCCPTVIYRCSGAPAASPQSPGPGASRSGPSRHDPGPALDSCSGGEPEPRRGG